MPKRIPISTAKAVAEKHDLTQVLLVGWDGERVHIVTYGKTKEDCAIAANAQDFWSGKIREFSFKNEYLNTFCVAGKCTAEDCREVKRCLGH